MNNTVLFHRSSFFVDVCNVVLHTDLFLYHELKERIDNGDTLLDKLFTKTLPHIESSNSLTIDTFVIQKSATKNNQNILLDWINKPAFHEINIGMSLYDFVANLYYDIFMNPTCDDYIQMTEFGNTLKLLTTDSNFDILHLYIPFESECIYNNLMDSFAGVGISKITVLIGDKKQLFAEQNDYDSYVFENTSDIDTYLDFKQSKPKEVLIPNYEYNLVEDRTDLEKLTEQITYQRLNLRHPSEYYKEHQLFINTIGVPL